MNCINPQKSSNLLNVIVYSLLFLFFVPSIAFTSNPPDSLVQKLSPSYQAIHSLFTILPNSAAQEHRAKVKKWADDQNALLCEIERELQEGKSLVVIDTHVYLHELNSQLRTFFGGDLTQEDAEEETVDANDLKKIHSIIIKSLSPLLKCTEVLTHIDPLAYAAHTFANALVVQFVKEDHIEFSVWGWIKDHKLLLGGSALAFFAYKFCQKKQFRLLARTNKPSPKPFLEKVVEEVDEGNSVYLTKKDIGVDQKNQGLNVENEEDSYTFKVDCTDKVDKIDKVNSIEFVITADTARESWYLQKGFFGQFQEALTRIIGFDACSKAGLTKEQWKLLLLQMKEAARLRKLGCTDDNIIQRLALDLMIHNNHVKDIKFDDALLCMKGLEAILANETIIRAFFRYSFIRSNNSVSTIIEHIYLKIRDNEFLCKIFAAEYRSYYKRDLIKTVDDYYKTNPPNWQSEVSHGLLDMSMAIMRQKSDGHQIFAKDHKEINWEITSLDGFKNIPKYIRDDVTQINLSRQKLIEIEDGAFSAFPKLQEINLNRCFIGKLHVNSFKGLPNLKKLRIDGAHGAIISKEIREVLPVNCDIVV